MTQPTQSSLPSLGIIACGGAMPVTIAKAAQKAGQPFHIVAIEDAASEHVESFPHTWVKIGELGRVLKLLKDNEVRQLVIVGNIQRPDFSTLRFDFGAVANLPAILNLTVGGDNSILSSIVDFFDSKGFEVVGAQEIAPDLLVRSGVLGRHRPGKKDMKDIEMGLDVVKTLGALDVGQGAVVASQYVLAVEAAEGTDQMLARCKELSNRSAGKNKKPKGVLIKCAKPGQEQRIDLPTVGPKTVHGVIDAGLRGIALSANGVLALEREEMIKLADKAGIFIIGIETDSPAQA